MSSRDTPIETPGESSGERRESSENLASMKIEDHNWSCYFEHRTCQVSQGIRVEGVVYENGKFSDMKSTSKFIWDVKRVSLWQRTNEAPSLKARLTQSRDTKFSIRRIRFHPLVPDLMVNNDSCEKEATYTSVSTATTKHTTPRLDTHVQSPLQMSLEWFGASLFVIFSPKPHYFTITWIWFGVWLIVLFSPELIFIEQNPVGKAS